MKIATSYLAVIVNMVCKLKILYIYSANLMEIISD